MEAKDDGGGGESRSSEPAAADYEQWEAIDSEARECDNGKDDRPRSRLEQRRQWWKLDRRHARKGLAELGQLVRPECLGHRSAAHDRREGACDLRVELRSRFVFELECGLLDGKRGPIGSCRCHRIEAVGDDQKMGLDRHLRARNGEVPTTVVALMVELDEARDSAGELERRKQTCREPRMAADVAQLRVGQPALLR